MGLEWDRGLAVKAGVIMKSTFYCARFREQGIVGWKDLNCREGNLAVRTEGWIRMGLETRIKRCLGPPNTGMKKEE